MKRSRRATTPERAPPGRPGWRLLAVALAALAYFTVASSEGVPLSPAPPRTYSLLDSDDIVPHHPHYGYYNLLVDGFLDGQLGVPVRPQRALLALPDPYDPVANDGHRQNDAALFRGRYYLYFGPTPAVVFFLPARLLGLRVTEALATAVFALGAFAAQLALLDLLLRRYFPGARPWMVALSVAALLCCNWMPHLLVYPAVYQVAIACGQCFLFAAILLLVDGALRRAPGRLALGSLCLGLAVGARATCVLAVPLVGLLAMHLARGGWGPALRRELLALFVPVASCGALLGLYNLLRFGSIFETGYRLTLSVVDASRMATFTWGNLVAGLYFYLLAPLKTSALFPFLGASSAYPGDLPPGYIVSDVSGLLASSPVMAGALALPFIARGLARRGPLGAIPVALAAVGAGILLFVAFGFPFAAARYQADFAALLLLPALLAWFHLRDAAETPRARAGLSVAFAALAACSVVAGVATATGGSGGFVRLASPGAWRAWERAFEPLTVALASGSRARLLERRDAPLVFRYEDRRLRLAADDATRLVVWLPRDGTLDLTAGFASNPQTVPGVRLGYSVCDGDRWVLGAQLPARSTYHLHLTRGLHEVRLVAVDGRHAPCDAGERPFAVRMEQPSLTFGRQALLP